jgi:carbon monoxide dehydrogenase subunit G
MAGFGMTVTERIAAPPETVFAAASNFGEAAGTIRGILRVEMLTPGPVGVGTRFRETRKMFGKEASEVMTVSEFEPPHRYVLLAESHGSRYRSELRFDPAGGGTDVTMTFQAEPLTFGAKVMSFVFRPMMKSVSKLCAQDLVDLKQSVESRQG